MFDNLSTRLEGIVKKIRGKGRLTEADVDEVMKEIRTALLEADVNVTAVRSICNRIREHAIGATRSQSLDPGQQVIKAVSDELTSALGGIEILYETTSGQPGAADRLYLEQDPGPAMAVALRGWTEAYDVPRTDFSAADGEGMMLNLDSDLRMVDHRAIGWPEQNFEAFRERIRSLVDLDAELLFVVARVRRVDGVLSLVELVMTVTSREGAVQTDRNLLTPVP